MNPPSPLFTDPQWRYTPLVVPMALSVLLILGLLGLGIRRRYSSIALPYLVFMVSLLIWMSTSALEIITLDLELSLFWADLSFLGTTFLPIGWWAFVMIYTGRNKQLNTWLPFLLVVPVLTNLVIWTNPWHGGWRAEPYRDLVTAAFPITTYNYRVWFYAVHLPFSLGLTFWAMGSLIRSMVFAQPAYRKQIIVLVLAFALPILADILHRFGLSPIPNYNISTLLFPISGLLVGWALLQFGFLDITPIARDQVIESLEDAMLVLDTTHHVLDMNPTARNRLFHAEASILGQPIEQLLPQQALFLQALQAHQPSSETRLYQSGEWRDYTLRISPIRYHSGHPSGYVVLLQDITARKRAEAFLHEQLKQMAVLEERQRLAQELHDSVNQSLFSAGIMANLLPQALDEKPERLPEYTRAIQQLIQGAAAQMRLTLLELHSDALLETDLGTSIQQLCAAYTGNTGVVVAARLADDVRLTEAAHIAFYRVAQEALHNIHKHADATQVVVELQHAAPQSCLTISDNGVGFRLEGVAGGHFGLSNMAKRAEAIGASLEVQSELGVGTTIRLTWEAT